MTLYILDGDLLVCGMIDTFRSLIWAERYNEAGDCELYLKATNKNLELLQMGRYIARSDTNVICQIRKIEIDTSPEDGDYIIVTGVDAKALLDQRIVWGTMYCDGNVDEFCAQMVNETCINPEITSRRMAKSNNGNLLQLGVISGELTASTKQQMSYVNVGEKIREFCKAYEYGYSLTLLRILNTSILQYNMYAGQNKDDVIFSEMFNNIASTKYIEDNTELGNVALVCGEGVGIERSRSTYGYAEGVNRHEIFIDARNTTRSMSFAELTQAYPLQADGGNGYVSGCMYYVTQLDVKVIDGNQRAWLAATYPDGTFVTISGEEYYRLADIAIADLAAEIPTSETSIKMRDIIYSTYLFDEGKQAVSGFGLKKTFEGEIIPNVAYVYRTDYSLGDVVQVRNEYGESASARILEVVECWDENGYTVEPKFTYQVEHTAPSIPSGQTIGYEQGAKALADGYNYWDLETGDLNIRKGRIRIETSNEENDYIRLSYRQYTALMRPLELEVMNSTTEKAVQIQAGGIWIYDNYVEGVSNVNRCYLGNGYMQVRDTSGVTGVQVYASGAGQVGLSLYDTSSGSPVSAAALGRSSTGGHVSAFGDGGSLRAQMYVTNNDAGATSFSDGSDTVAYLTGDGGLRFLAYSGGIGRVALSAWKDEYGGKLMLYNLSGNNRSTLSTDSSGNGVLDLYGSGNGIRASLGGDGTLTLKDASRDRVKLSQSTGIALYYSDGVQRAAINTQGGIHLYEAGGAETVQITPNSTYGGNVGVKNTSGDWRATMGVDSGDVGRVYIYDSTGTVTTKLLHDSLQTNKVYPLGQTGEYINDFVIAYGTSSSWQYRKWYSGKCELWRTSYWSNKSFSALGSVYVTGNISLSFPFTFASPPIVYATAGGRSDVSVSSSWVICAGGTDGPTVNSTGNWQCVRPVSGSATIGINWYVVGTLAS